MYGNAARCGARRTEMTNEEKKDRMVDAVQNLLAQAVVNGNEGERVAMNRLFKAVMAAPAAAVGDVFDRMMEAKKKGERL
jgi:hypothetical protein